jgi:hypothetical protein
MDSRIKKGLATLLRLMEPTLEGDFFDNLIDGGYTEEEAMTILKMAGNTLKNMAKDLER